MNTEQTFQAANKYLRGRVNVLNNMSSRELSAQMLPEIRAMSFFSARVAEARVLDKLRDVSDRYSSGQIDKASARLEIKNWLNVKDPSTSSGLANVKDESIREALMSTSRLNLILDQNQSMAAAVGARELALDPEIYEALPYYKYMPSTAAVPRDAHQKYYGLILDKKDPFWITHTPPWDFNCKCSLDELTAAEAGKNVSKASPVAVDRQTPEGSRPALDESGSSSSWTVSTPEGNMTVDYPESGYVFDAKTALSTCDMSRVDSPSMRSAIFAQLEKFGKDKTLNFRCIPKFTPMAEAAVTGMPEISKVSDAVAKFASGAGMEAVGVKLGEISPALRTATGMPEGILKLSRGDKNLYGLIHAAVHHKQQFANGEFVKAINDTVFASGGKVRTSIEFRGGRKYLRLINLRTGAFTAFVELKSGEWELVQAFPNGADYEGKMNVVRAKKNPAAVAGTLTQHFPVARCPIRLDDTAAVEIKA